MMTIDDALHLTQQTVDPLSCQFMSLQDALHYTLAEDVVSPIDLPLFDQSAVDGYAVALTAHEVHAQQHYTLLEGERRAGINPDLQLEIGQAIRIFTGASLPMGATAVVRQEIVQATTHGRIDVLEPIRLGQDIRYQGEETRKGQCLAQAGQDLNVGAIAALSMAGVSQVMVYRQPRIALLVSGDEVVAPGQPLLPGQIYDANTALVQSWLTAQRLNADIWHIDDHLDQVVEQLTQLRTQYDLIITTGGVSVGDYDFIRPAALTCEFEQIIWKIAQKPGKPLFLGCYQTQNHRCALLGLPGNPAAVFVGLMLYAQTIINRLSHPKRQLEWLDAILTSDLKPDSRERLLRMRYDWQLGQYYVHPLEGQQSHMLGNLMFANCLVRIKAGQMFVAGQSVPMLLLQ